MARVNDVSDITFARIFLAIDRSEKALSVREISEIVGKSRSVVNCSILELQNMGCIEVAYRDNGGKRIPRIAFYTSTGHGCEFCK